MDPDRAGRVARAKRVARAVVLVLPMLVLVMAWLATTSPPHEGSIPSRAEAAATATVTVATAAADPLAVPGAGPLATAGAGPLAAGAVQEEADPLAAGIAALRGGDIGVALGRFEAAVAARPDDAQAHFYLGLARLQAGDPGGAVEALERARALTARFDPLITYQLGVALMRTGQFDAAREQYSALLERDPSAPQPRLNLGWILLQEERGKQALETFEAVAEDHPSWAPARYWIAFVHHADGRFAEAAATYEKCLELNPRLTEARLGLGRLMVTMGEVERARRLLTEVLSSRPDLAEAHFQLALLELRQGDLEAAIEELEAAVALDPGHQGALYNLGRAYARAGRSVEAAAELSTFAALERERRQQHRRVLRGQAESRAESYYRAGVEALGRVDPEAAIEAFETAIAAAGDASSAAMHLGLGSGLLQTGRTSEARVALETAVRLDPLLAAAHRLLSQAYSLLGLEDLAEEARRAYERLRAAQRRRDPGQHPGQAGSLSRGSQALE